MCPRHGGRRVLAWAPAVGLAPHFFELTPELAAGAVVLLSPLALQPQTPHPRPPDSHPSAGSVLYTVFEVQAWLSLFVSGLLSFNLIFPSDQPDIARLMG